MLKHFSILTRLAGCMSMLLGLLIACACIGIFGLNTLSATAEHAVSQDVQLAQRAARIEILVLNERRYEKDTLINLSDGSKFTAYRQKWNDTRDALLQELAAVSHLQLEDSDRRLLGQIDASHRSYIAGFEHTAEVIRSGRIKATQEANDEVARFKDAIHATEEASRELHHRAISRVDELPAQVAMTRGRSAALQTGIAILCVVLGIVLCITTARSITYPLTRAKAIAEAVASGKLDNQIDDTGEDETARVLRALKVMQQSLLESELNAKGQIAAIGKALAVVEFDLNGAIQTANQNFLTLFGYELHEIRGRPHHVLLPRDERIVGLDPALWARLGRGELDAGQYERVSKDGRKIFIQASYNPILNTRGVPHKIVMYASDVSEQVSMKRALDATVKEAQEVVRVAIDGELSRRMSLGGKTGQIEALALSINAFVENMGDVVASIQRAVDEVGNATREISSGSESLTQRTCEQAASLEETSSNMQEMTGSVRSSVGNAEQARQLALAARTQANRGEGILREAIASMGQISAASSRIADIIAVVDEIAFQTNLLALNAAVEAARAGEQGSGFAVVANEVRALAGRSAAAAKEIKSLISDSVSKIQAGTRIVDQAGTVLGDIDAAVKRVVDVIDQIADASQQQASGIDQVNSAIAQIDEVTQQNATLAEQSTAMSHTIVQQVNELAELVAHYGHGADAPALTRPTAPVARAVLPERTHRHRDPVEAIQNGRAA